MGCLNVSLSVPRKIACAKGRNCRQARLERRKQQQRCSPLDWYQNLFELIDMRSFSNLWYWIALAVMWSTASHWVLGVPYDMVTRARGLGGQSELDLEELCAINVRRILLIGQMAGLWLLGLICFALSSLLLLGFAYGVEFAQAVFLLAFPMALVGLLSLSNARLIDQQALKGAALIRRLGRHRLFVQAIGVVSIFVTAMWGMYQNLTIGAL